MKTIQLTEIEHRGKTRIAAFFPYDAALVQLCKNAGMTYSKTFRCWYIERTEDNYRKVKEAFVDFNVTETLTGLETTVRVKEKSFWQKDMKRLSLDPSQPPLKGEEKDVPSIVIRIDKEKKKIYVKHPVDKELFSAIRGIEKSFWQKDKKEWVLPGTNECLLLVRQTAKKAGYAYKTEIIKTAEEKESIVLVQYYIDSLRLKNYSPNTVDAYVPYFKQFVIHFGENKIDDLGLKQLHEYVRNITPLD